MKLNIHTVDAFADAPFTGNPAAVCILKNDIDDNLKQLIAMEINLSETAFVIPRGSAFGLRWFTPKSEVELCGHATLASAHILWKEGFVPANEAIEFQTLWKGSLFARKIADMTELDFPAVPPRRTDHERAVRDAVKPYDPVYIGLSGNHFLAELRNDEQVRDFEPDFGTIAKLPHYGLIITARDSKGNYDFVSRFFAPAVGVNEDPATGSAHCALTPYWHQNLGRTKFRAYQMSERGAKINTELLGDRVLISGKAVTVLKCEMTI